MTPDGGIVGCATKIGEPLSIGGPTAAANIVDCDST